MKRDGAEIKVASSNEVTRRGAGLNESLKIELAKDAITKDDDRGTCGDEIPRRSDESAIEGEAIGVGRLSGVTKSQQGFAITRNHWSDLISRRQGKHCGLVLSDCPEIGLLFTKPVEEEGRIVFACDVLRPQC